jgi:hypothetical protein
MYKSTLAEGPKPQLWLLRSYPSSLFHLPSALSFALEGIPLWEHLQRLKKHSLRGAISKIDVERLKEAQSLSADLAALGSFEHPVVVRHND